MGALLHVSTLKIAVSSGSGIRNNVCIRIKDVFQHNVIRIHEYSEAHRESITGASPHVRNGYIWTREGYERFTCP
jgi:hypothetical protein